MEQINPFDWITYFDTVAIGLFEIEYLHAHYNPGLFHTVPSGDWEFYVRETH